MLILHANWMPADLASGCPGGLRLWAEDADAARRLVGGVAEVGCDDGSVAAGTLAVAAPPAAGSAVLRHPYAASADAVAAAVGRLLGTRAPAFDTTAAPVRLRLPHGEDAAACPSDRLVAVGGLPEPVPTEIRPVDVPAVRVDPAAAAELLLRLESLEESASGALAFGHGLAWWYAVAQLAEDLLAGQRFVPSLVQRTGSGLRAAWHPWLHDDGVRDRLGLLIAAMPPQVRAAVDARGGRPWAILEEALGSMVDARVRSVLLADDYADALEGRDAGGDPHVAWLAGLLAGETRVARRDEDATSLMRSVAEWLGVLVPTSDQGGLRLVLRLAEPDEAALPEDVAPARDGARWRLSCSLAGRDVEVEAERLWSDPHEAAALLGAGERHPEEVLVAELGRAARVFPKLEEMLAHTHPSSMELSTAETHRFLAEFAGLLRESGIDVIAPGWWGSEEARLTARLEIAPSGGGAGGGGESGPELGLASLVHFRWRIAIGDRVLSAEDVRALAEQARGGAALVRLRGRWVELRAEEVAEAKQLLEDGGEGEMSLLEAVRLAGGGRGGLPVQGIDASGWVADLLEGSADTSRMPRLDQPEGFDGELRPYQAAGLSWLAFLDRMGLGACLADDMGLGKTIQLIALLQHERERLGSSPGPTLLIVPTSVVSNWRREIGRFAAGLRVHVQHGPDRPVGDRFIALAADYDVIITTYTLLSRDRDTLLRTDFHRVVLDEAQYIKNPPTKQTATIRALRARRRIALTGTPVENRLSELWSIIEFCNPGYLGPQSEFRRLFAVPIERHRDGRRAEQLRALVRPFILRRVKTDPTVIDDLPACLTTREYAVLTPEQATMYEQTVEDMLGEVGRAEGIKRRGLVLATLVRLKQICNHPAQAMGKDQPLPPPAGLAARSGKCRRMMDMMEELLAAGDRALVFTQFRRMGEMLVSMMRHELDTDVLFLHGGTPAARRQEMVDRFQAEGDAPPVFVLSLRAGGIGLNLTAANHVFHFDRWWNPAVENQATDRAFRIGQTRTVQVHKFICEGTLEERIDRMIERKTELAENIIGTGEDWLTELSTVQLRDLLTLRNESVEDAE